MNKKFTIALFSVFALGAIAQPQISLSTYASGFTEPVDISNAGDDRLFVVERAGVIKVVQSGGTVNATPFLDISSQVYDNNNEQGLLGLAFHPNYAVNGYFYVNYIDNSQNTQISRFTVSGGDPDIADGASEFQILNVSQPYWNHDGGCIQFGPDGYLYIGMGDGGSGGDPGNRAQDGGELLGKMLRIDVDGGSPYAIPADNPFVSDGTVLDEIWAIGLRNPWRFSFDRVDGSLWIADVGQDTWEEVNYVPGSSTGGENYGWRCYEASAPYNTSGCDPSSLAYQWPVYEYSQSGTPPNGCSIIGGYMYRGLQHPGLQGYYLFSDACGNWIYTLNWDGAAWQTIDHGIFSGSFSTFGEDYVGEMYVAGLFDGNVYQIEDLLTGLDETTTNFVTSVFPNPFEDKTTIQFSNQSGGTHTLRVYDISGQLVVLESGITGSTVEVDGTTLDNGFYFFELLDHNGHSVGTGKLVAE